MMMPDRTMEDEPNVVTVEEAIDCRRGNSRFFSLINHESGLNVIISRDSSIISFNLEGQEIAVDKSLYNQTHEAWAIADKSYQKLTALPWNCHVRGSELILSASNGASSIIYELNRHNELNNIVKLKNIHLQHQVTYFNLNNAKVKTPIDGHTIIVRCNGNMNRIQIQHTKLLCQCNKISSILPQSLVGDIPFELRQNASGNSSETTSEDDLIVCDAIFSLEATCSLDFLQAHLQFNNRILVFEVRSCITTAGLSTNRSSAKIPVQVQPVDVKPKDINFYYQQKKLKVSSNNSQIEDPLKDVNPIVIKTEPVDNLSNQMSASSADIKPVIINSTNGPQSTSTSMEDIKTNSNINCHENRAHSSTTLRIRIRVTNFGACLMPYMMTNYTSTYRFAW